MLYIKYKTLLWDVLLEENDQVCRSYSYERRVRSCVSFYAPGIIPDDADGLICVRYPRDGRLGQHLTQRVNVSAGVRQVHEVLEHSGLVGKMGSF